MDSITQAALGGVVGELVLGRKLGWRGMAWGLCFGTLPDLDVLVSPFLDDVTRLKWHRGISHSILLMFVGAFVFMMPLSWIHRERGLLMARAWWFVFLTWSTHVLIDVFTTYGTQVWEPFSEARVSLNNMSIIDPLFTIPLLICVLITVVRFTAFIVRVVKYMCAPGEERGERPQEPRFSGKVARIALVLSCGYALFSLGMKVRAMNVIKERVVEKFPEAELVQLAPTLGNTILWRGMAKTEEGYLVTYWSPFDDESAEWDFYPKNAQLAEPFREEALFQGLEWFSQGHWVTRRLPSGEIVLIDMRFGELRDPISGSQFAIFQWHLSYDEDGNFCAPSYKSRPQNLDHWDLLSKLMGRILGDQSSWQNTRPF